MKVRKDTAHIANPLEEGAMLWHERLGHLNMASFKELGAMVDGMNLKEVPLHHICEACVKGKHQRTSFPKDGATKASQLLEIVHTNVCGPMRTTSHGGARYFLTFIDDFSRKTHVYFLKAKGEAFEKFKQNMALVENKIGHKIKVLQSNNGGEFGMEMERDRAQRLLYINQIGYLKEILKHFRMEDYKAIRMPLDPKTKLKKNENKDVEMVKLWDP